MHCPNCGASIDDGKFCTECGSPLPEEHVTIHSEEAASNPAQKNAQENNQTQQPSPNPQEASKGLDIADYYMTLFKQPDQAIKTTAKAIIPGLITLVVFALLDGAESYYLMNQIADGYIAASTVDDFLLPTLSFAIMAVIISALTFAALKLTGQELSFQDVFAKYTALLIPFVLLFIIGFIFEIITLETIGHSLVSVSISATRIAIPAIIILNSQRKKIDLLYVLIGLFSVTYIARTYLDDLLAYIFI